MLQAKSAFASSSGGVESGAYPAFSVYAPLSRTKVFSGKGCATAEAALAEVRGLVVPIFGALFADKISSSVSGEHGTNNYVK